MDLDSTLIAIIAAIPTALGAYLVYRRSTKADKITADAGISTFANESIQQVFNQQQNLISNLQEDNRLLRLRIDKLQREIDEIRDLLVQQEKKY